MTMPPITACVVVPDGVYRLGYQRHSLGTRFGRGSLELWFRIMDFGPHFQKPLCRYYKVSLSGRRSFNVGNHSVFAREFAAIFRRRPPSGVQALKWFGNDILVEAFVETVKKGHDQREIPEAAQYSVIRSLERRAEP